ncbi:MAG: MerR family transcriptional regulator [bacterium]
MMKRIYTAGEAATFLGIPYHRLDYYERVGKIPPAHRTGTNQRIYTHEELLTLKKLLSDQNLPTKQLRGKKTEIIA